MLVAAPAMADDHVDAHSNGVGTVTLNGDLVLGGEVPSGSDGEGSDDAEIFTSYDNDLCGPNEMLVETFQRAGLENAWQLAKIPTAVVRRRLVVARC